MAEEVQKEVKLRGGSMGEFNTRLKALPSKLMDVVNGFIDGVTRQISTVKGSLILLIGLVIVFDILFKGSIGVIAFSIEQFKVILLAIADVMKAGGWQLIIIALILVMLRKDK